MHLLCHILGGLSEIKLLLLFSLEACLKIKVLCYMQATNTAVSSCIHAIKSGLHLMHVLVLSHDLVQYRTYNFMIKTTYGYSLETFKRG